MKTELNRRSLITGLISFVAAPAIVRAQSIMPVKLMAPEFQVPPVYFQDRMFWVTKDEPQIVQFSLRYANPEVMPFTFSGYELFADGGFER